MLSTLVFLLYLLYVLNFVTSTVLMHYPFGYFSYVQNQSFTWSWYCSSPTDNWRRYRCIVHPCAESRQTASEYALISPANMSPDSPDRRLMGSTMAAKTVGIGRGVSLTGNCSSSSAVVGTGWYCCCIWTAAQGQLLCCQWPVALYSLLSRVWGNHTSIMLSALLFTGS